MWSLLWSAALATTPLWNGDDAVLWGTTDVDRAGVIVQTQSGTVLVSQERLEQYDADTTAQITELPWVHGGGLRSAPGCDLDGDGSEEVADVVDGGAFTLRDPFTGVVTADLLPTVTTPSGRVGRVRCADLDADGSLEIAASLGDHQSRVVWVWDADGTELVEHAVQRGSVVGLAIGELDGDASLELVLPDRRVVDGTSTTVERTLDPDVDQVKLVDVDGDGIDEILEARGTTWTLVGGPVPITVMDAADALVDDFDGDGAFELVYDVSVPYSVHWTDRYVVDVATGLERHPAARGRACTSDWVRHDHDGDGVAQAHCRANSSAQVVFDTVLGERVLYRGNATINFEPHAGDLHGDGDAEVLWVSRADSPFDDRLVVRDAEGQLLDVIAMDDTHLIRPVDVDGDGADEIVRGHEVWRWSPATGLVSQPDLFPPTGVPRITLASSDFDGDGDRDVLTMTYGGFPTPTTYLLDTGSGFERDLGNHQRAVVADLDGDGSMEIVSHAAILDARGDVLTPIPDYGGVTEVGGQTYIIRDLGAQLDVVRWRPGRPQRVASFQLPWSIYDYYGYVSGRIWVRSFGDLHGWSPVDGSVVTRPYGSITYTIADDVLWTGFNDLAKATRLR
jgi:hypothetical protein